ncbi:uncharacterized protein LOC133310624 [Gastrolobium bilobum]|uniref:uncharacterized protein LOC133310624 n=1 Tax=Gastrolobium bilobum TaxID=150636 RepID=UPI002AB2AE62|nr:uncharacterized protein LOC133310624 [Gastrolobium bilobum]
MRVQDLAEEFASHRVEIQQRLDQISETLDARLSSISALDARFAAIDARLRDMSPHVSPHSSSSASSLPPHMEFLDTRNPCKQVKMEIPAFNGTDPNNWIFKTELYFRLQQIPEALKVHLAGLKMKGAAAPWYQWIYGSGTVNSWPEFCVAVKQRFAFPNHRDVSGVLSKLTQTGTLSDYMKEFERLMNQVTNLGDDLLMEFFVSGLQPELRGAIQLHWPTSLHHAMQLAMSYDSHFNELRSSFNSSTKKFVPNRSSPLPSWKNSTDKLLPSTSTVVLTQGNTSAPLALQSSSLSSLPIKKLPPEELQRKRDLGICYTCDEKWTASHRCKARMLLLIGESDDPPHEPEEEVVWQVANTDENVTHAALHILAASVNPRSLQLSALIRKQEVVVLIDSGSSHNFIRKQLADDLQLPMSRVTRMKVFMGNGEYMICEKKCVNVSLLIQGLEFVVDLWVADLSGLSVILGMCWLSQLGRVSHDYGDQSIKFAWQGGCVKLCGISDGVSQHSIAERCCILEGHPGNIATGELTSELETYRDKVPFQLWQVLVRCELVFAIPKSLPPFRGMDHCIHLSKDSQPVNVKPYRYPYQQKGEIERQVSKLLSSGFIQYSKSPFSSLFCW